MWNWRGIKKSLEFSVEARRGWVDRGHPELSVTRQAELAGIFRSGLYYAAVVDAAALELMRAIDEIYTEFPYYGSRRMAAQLGRQGQPACRERVQRLMRLMGIEAIYPKPRTSKPHPDHKIYPYLLGGVTIERVNQVWSCDITYIRLKQSWLYLIAIMDWFSRYVLAWELSPTMEVDFCLTALERALAQNRPEIFNTDQGSQFTSLAFTGMLLGHQIRISMDGRGRAFDNIFNERLWRSVKYEEVYLNDYQTPREARLGIGGYFERYNDRRLHQSLAYRTPAEVYFG